MDLTKLDSIIEELEKKTTVRPGSPPTVVHGHRGIWRTVRGFRMFLELEPGMHFPGKVLIGPPSFVDHTLNDAPSDAWEALTPRKTTAEFQNIDVAPNGVDTLKDAIKNSIDPKDTRNEALKSLNTPLQLVPIARSAGFKDEEIKQALKGKSPNKPLKEPTEEASPEKPEAPEAPEKPKNNVVSLPTSPEKPEAPEKPEPPKGNDTVTQGSLAIARQLAPKPNETSEERKKRIQKLLEAWADKITNDDILQAKVRSWAKGLRSEDYTLPEVVDKIQEAATNRRSLGDKKPTKEQLDALDDRAEIKEFINNFETTLEEKINEGIDRAQSKFKPSNESGVSDARIKELADAQRAQSEDFKRQREETKRMREAAARDRQKAQEYMSEAQKGRLEVDAALALLEELSSKVKSPQIKQEIIKIKEGMLQHPFSKRSILLRLYQLLQILLLLIPGL